MRSELIMPHSGGWCKADECINWPPCELKPEKLTIFANEFWCRDCEWCGVNRPIPFKVTPSGK